MPTDTMFLAGVVVLGLASLFLLIWTTREDRGNGYNNNEEGKHER